MPAPLPLTYVLHSGELFGTERMALATLLALRPEFEGLILAPPGPIHRLARESGIASIETPGRLALVSALFKRLRQQPGGALCTTGVWQALATCALQRLVGGHGTQLHAVHGGTDERLSYGRKRWLQPFDIRLVAVSEFVRDRLIAHGVSSDRIDVIHNFLPAAETAGRGPFKTDGVKRVVMLSRLDRIKRVGLLFDALDCMPELAALEFDIFGSGEQFEALRERALAHRNVRLAGFVPDAAAIALPHADLLLHTCPEEPFGLVLLEAFAAGVPVLAPNAGGAASIVRDGIEGWHFSANDPLSLGRRLLELSQADAATLERVAGRGRLALATRFTPQAQAGRYAELLRSRS